MKTIKVMRDGRPATAEELQCAVDGKPLPPRTGSAKFVIQRPEYPDWFAGWSEQGGGPCWTSSDGDAVYVQTDDLVETLTKLQKHKPIAALISPNVPDQRP